jgi:hypothetical protein
MISSSQNFLILHIHCLNSPGVSIDRITQWYSRNGAQVARDKRKSADQYSKWRLHLASVHTTETAIHCAGAKRDNDRAFSWSWL